MGHCSAMRQLDARSERMQSSQVISRHRYITRPSCTASPPVISSLRSASNIVLTRRKRQKLATSDAGGFGCAQVVCVARFIAVSIEQQASAHAWSLTGAAAHAAVLSHANARLVA